MGKGQTNVPPQRFNKDKGFNPKVQGGQGAKTSPISKKRGRLHKRECLAGSNACFKCGKSDHQAKGCRSGGGVRWESLRQCSTHKPIICLICWERGGKDCGCHK